MAVTMKLEDFSVAGVASALAGIVEEITPPARGEGEYTLEEYRKAIEAKRKVKFSRRQADWLLTSLVAEGKFEKVVRLDPDSGRRVYCYVQVEPTDD